MSLPLLSVVTISFNQTRFLEQALTSVLDQDYTNIEYVVVDPGSTDGSRDIIERYRDRITHIVYEKDNGPADGLNRGLARCTGEFFCYLNSDDFFLPGAFRRAITFLQAEPDLAFINGDGFIVDENNKPIRRFISAPFDLWRYAYGHSVVCQQSTFFRRAAIDEAGGFNNDYRVMWDPELILKITKRGGKSKLVHEYWSAFRMHGDSITCDKRLADLHRQTHELLFRLIMERDPRWYDTILVHPARLIRWSVDPIGLWERIKPLHGEMTL